jgi:hypothetical protein
MKLNSFYRVALLLVFLTACGGLSPASTPTSTPVVDTSTPTATIVWFPPTNTPSPIPARTTAPTPDQRPGLAELLFSDIFDQPDLWSKSVSDWASATVNRNRLVLSISGSGPVSILSLRSQPVLRDFYAEAMAKLSLCGGRNQFGMVFRSASGQDYYRFTVSCDGQARAERVRSGSNTPLLDWFSSGDIPSAAPAGVKLGVWAVGGEMRFFLNDHFQFSVRDSILSSGTLGFFAYANAADPITVSFSDLAVYSVAYTSPTPSPTPSRTPSPTP